MSRISKSGQAPVRPLCVRTVRIGRDAWCARLVCARRSVWCWRSFKVGAGIPVLRSMGISNPDPQNFEGGGQQKLQGSTGTFETVLYLLDLTLARVEMCQDLAVGPSLAELLEGK